MAKDWEKKWKKMDPYERRVAMNEMGEFYGVEGVGPGSRGGSGRTAAHRHGGGYGRETERPRTHEDVQRGINDAMASGPTADYLMNKGQGLPHANDMGGMYGIHKQMEKAHGKNSGGSFNNLSDAFNLAQTEFNMSKDNLKDEILEDVLDQVGDNDDDNDNDNNDSTDDDYNSQSLEEAYNTGNLSPSFMDALTTRNANTSAQTAAQQLLANTVREITENDDEDGLLNSDKYLIDYSQPYNGLNS